MFKWGLPFEGINLVQEDGEQRERRSKISSLLSHSSSLAQSIQSLSLCLWFRFKLWVSRLLIYWSSWKLSFAFKSDGGRWEAQTKIRTNFEQSTRAHFCALRLTTHSLHLKTLSSSKLSSLCHWSIKMILGGRFGLIAMPSEHGWVLDAINNNFEGCTRFSQILPPTPYYRASSWRRRYFWEQPSRRLLEAGLRPDGAHDLMPGFSFRSKNRRRARS